MKKIVTVLSLMFVSLMIFGQEPTQTQTQTQIQTGEQSGDPIMTQERIRANEGLGKMTRAEKREMRKENHGSIVSETAQNASSESGKGKSVSGVANQKGIQQQDRDRTNYQKMIKPKTGKPTNFGKPMNARPSHQARPITPPRGGRK